MAWQERGPFRTRVVSEAAAGSFRDSANAEIVEIEWAGPEVEPARIVPHLVGAGLSLIVALSASYQLSRIREERLYLDESRPELYLLVASSLTIAFVVQVVRRIKRVRDERARGVKRTLRITSTMVELHLPSGLARQHAIGSTQVELEEHDGRRQAVLVADGDRTVLHESLHEREVEWLVSHIRDALSRH